MNDELQAKIMAKIKILGSIINLLLIEVTGVKITAVAAFDNRFVIRVINRKHAIIIGVDMPSKAPTTVPAINEAAPVACNAVPIAIDATINNTTVLSIDLQLV